MQKEAPTAEERKDVFDCGLYRLRICKDGRWRTVSLDDFFPCFPMQV